MHEAVVGPSVKGCNCGNALAPFRLDVCCSMFGLAGQKAGLMSLENPDGSWRPRYMAGTFRFERPAGRSRVGIHGLHCTGQCQLNIFDPGRQVVRRRRLTPPPPLTPRVSRSNPISNQLCRPFLCS